MQERLGVEESKESLRNEATANAILLHEYRAILHSGLVLTEHGTDYIKDKIGTLHDRQVALQRQGIIPNLDFITRN